MTSHAPHYQCSCARAQVVGSLKSHLFFQAVCKYLCSHTKCFYKTKRVGQVDCPFFSNFPETLDNLTRLNQVSESVYLRHFFSFLLCPDCSEILIDWKTSQVNFLIFLLIVWSRLAFLHSVAYQSCRVFVQSPQRQDLLCQVFWWGLVQSNSNPSFAWKTSWSPVCGLWKHGGTANIKLAWTS